MKKLNYKLTKHSCMLGIIVQAIISNISAILFLPMMKMYNLNYSYLGILVLINFTVQVIADFAFSKIIDKVGYRAFILPTTVGSFVGLSLYGLAPFLFPNNVFVGVVFATIIMSFCSGLLEVLLSPIVAGIPSDNKSGDMSMMHSFFAWGQAGMVLVATLLLYVLGTERWYYILFIFALLPIINFIMFAKSPMPQIVVEEHSKQKLKLFNPLFIMLIVAIFLGGGTEVNINQWASTFMENGLGISKQMGDIFGMCGFAIMLGIGRTIYGKYGDRINAHYVLIGGAGFTVLLYLVLALSTNVVFNVIACMLCGFTVSLLWPLTIAIASNKFYYMGTIIFALLAAAGDMGCAILPFATGIIVDSATSSGIAESFGKMLGVTAEQGALRLGILAGTIFPLLLVIVHIIVAKISKKPEYQTHQNIGNESLTDTSEQKVS